MVRACTSILILAAAGCIPPLPDPPGEDGGTETSDTTGIGQTESGGSGGQATDGDDTGETTVGSSGDSTGDPTGGPEPIEVDLGGRPCLSGSDSALDFIVGGDPGDVTCSTPAGLGDGALPPGVSIDPTSCALIGMPQTGRFGTWAAIVVAETPDGSKAHVPYCVQRAQPPSDPYTVTTTYDGLTVPVGTPIEQTFDPAAAVDVGFAPPLVVQVVDTVGCPTCEHGVNVATSEIPADPPTTTAVAFTDDSADFRVDLTGPPVPAALQSRPWIAVIDLDLCLESDSGFCADFGSIDFHGRGDVAVAVILRPNGSPGQ